MQHYTEDELVLHYYGEGRRRGTVEHHLDECPTCAATLREISSTLTQVTAAEAPERDDQYGREVWQRIRHRLPEPEPRWWMSWMSWMSFQGAFSVFSAAGAAAVLCLAVATAFLAGRAWPRTDRLDRPEPPALSNLQAKDSPADAGDRVRLAAIGDHLERSERVLLDLVNAEGSNVDVSDQQAGAAALLDANRLYRQAAARAGDGLVAGVLDDLERNLLEIVHGPSTLTPAELEQLRLRLDAAALLFKVRILHDELREREAAPAIARKTT